MTGDAAQDIGKQDEWHINELITQKMGEEEHRIWNTEARCAWMELLHCYEYPIIGAVPAMKTEDGYQIPRHATPTIEKGSK